MTLRKIERLCAVICAMVCLLCIAMVFTVYIHRDRFEMILSGMAGTALVAGLWLLLTHFERRLTKKRVRLIFAAFCGLLLAEQAVLIGFLGYDYEMIDPKITGEFAKTFVMGGDMADVKESYRIYAAKYPNAWGMIFFQIPFFALWRLFTGGVSIYAGQVLNIIVIQLSVVFTFLTGERIFKSRSQQLFCGIITAMIPVMLMYTPFFHSDTAGMIFVSAAVYFLTLAAQDKSQCRSFLYAIAAGLFIAVGNSIKGSIAVMLIAAVIFFILKMGSKNGLILSAAAVLMFIGISKAVYFGGMAVGISDEQLIKRYRFPVTHWVMMSLNDEDKTHVDKDVDYTMSFKTYDDKKQANIREIKARLSKIDSPERLLQKLYHKAAITWGGSGFSYRKYLSNSQPKYRLKRILDSRTLKTYVDSCHAAMLIAMAFGVIYSAGKRRRETFFLCILTLAGVILFFLIWENPPRYIVTFMPVIMLICAAGNRYFCNFIRRTYKIWQERLHRSRRSSAA